MEIRFGDDLSLLGYSIFPTRTLQGGITLKPAVEWRADQPMTAHYQMAIQVVNERGHVWAEEDREPQNGFAPTTTWQVGKSVGDQYELKLPPTMPAGDYQLTVAVHWITAGKNNFFRASDERGDLGTEVVLTTFTILKDKTSHPVTDLWWIEPKLLVDMGEMRLLGFVPPRATIAPGELLQVGLYWRAREKPRGDYVVAVQLRDARGNIAFEQSARPANGTYATTNWDAGEVLLDWHDFILPRDLAPGAYQIAIVLQNVNGAQLGEALISMISVVE